MPQTELRQMLATLRPAPVREEAQTLADEGNEKLRQAKALFAMADALEGQLQDGQVSEPERNGRHNGNGNGHGPKPTNKRPRIHQIIAERPAPAWAPKEVHSTLIGRELIHPDTTLESIRVTMKRMVEKPRSEDERLIRTHEGFTLPGPVQGGLIT